VPGQARHAKAGAPSMAVESIARGIAVVLEVSAATAGSV
jgi:hypothetical protein